MARQLQTLNNYRSNAFVVALIACLIRINESSNVSSTSTKIDLLCLYNNTPTFHHPTAIYTCNLHGLNITTKLEIGSFKGTHLPGKSDKDVELLQFLSGTMSYIPHGIGKFFTNLKKLVVGDLFSLSSIGTKAIERQSFMNLEKLEEIGFVSHDIKKLEKDALWDLPNLQIFVVAAHKIKFLNVRTFERNEKLKGVAISSTELRHVTEHLFRYNLLLEAVFFDNNVIESISERAFQVNTKLRTVSMRSNKLQSLPANLFANNPLLYGVEFSDNILEIIRIDFTKFKDIKHVGFELNECIDATYEDGSSNPHRYNNLNKFQSVIRANCSSSH